MTQPSTALLLFIAYRHAENRILAAVNSSGHELTLAQSRILGRIGPEGTRLSELARQAQITRPTATALIDRLESAGYVERIADPADGRARLVTLSARALAEVAPVARHQEQLIEQEWTRHLGSERMAQLRRGLELLREISDV